MREERIASLEALVLAVTEAQPDFHGPPGGPIFGTADRLTNSVHGTDSTLSRGSLNLVQRGSLW